MIQEIAPDRFEKIKKYEKDFNHTIRSNISWEELAGGCGNQRIEYDPDIAKIAMSEDYDQPIWTETWTLPAGAFGESGGPT